MQFTTKSTFLIIVIFLFAAGCQSAAVEPPTPTPIQAAAATPTQKLVADDGPRHSVATCQPLETEEDDYTFDSDWIRGADDYSVTIIEYGDYQ